MFELCQEARFPAVRTLKRKVKNHSGRRGRNSGKLLEGLLG